MLNNLDNLMIINDYNNYRERIVTDDEIYENEQIWNNFRYTTNYAMMCSLEGMILETNNAFTKILEQINKKPVNLKYKNMNELNLKKIKGNSLKEKVTDFENILHGIYCINIEGKELNIKIIEKTISKIHRKTT